MTQASQHQQPMHLPPQSQYEPTQPPVTILYTSNGIPVQVVNANQPEVTEVSHFRSKQLFLCGKFSM